jgi:hypothetical protein
MIELLEKYIELYENEFVPCPESEQIMRQFFWYSDKIINGIINAYKFTRFAEMDDLIQEARMALLLSIHKQQFNIQKGSIFSFISVVTARNLINYTTKLNRNFNKRSDADIDLFFNNNSITYYQDFDQNIIIEDILSVLLKYFEGKPKLIKLTYLLIEYYDTHRSSRFVKKDFIKYAKSYNFSSAFTNSFFEMIQRAKNKKEIQDFLKVINSDLHENNNNFDAGHK